MNSTAANFDPRLYQVVLDRISHGVTFFDGQQRLILCNRRYTESYHLAPDDVRPGTTLSEIAERRIAVGTSPMVTEDVRSFLAWNNGAVSPAKPSSWDVELKDGRTIRMDYQPMTDGGWVVTHQEITERWNGSTGDERLSVQALIDWVPDYLWVKDAKGRFVVANTAVARGSGRAKVSDMIGLTDFDLHAPEAAREFRAMEEKILSTGQALIDREELTVEASGVEKWILSTKVPIRNDKGEIFGLVGIARDITKRKNDETALRRLNRTLQTLSAADEALVRGSSEQQLLDEMCRIVVEVGGYRLAWIGFAENDAGKTMRLVALAGERPEHVDSIQVTWADTAFGRGPSGIAIRSGQTQLSRNIETDLRIAPWRKEMLECGFMSNIALPHKNGGGPFGCLTLYSGEVDAFGPDEIVLLEKLAADLSFGIYAWREHAGHERATSALQESLRATVEAVAKAVELRDAYTAGHQRHVAELAAAIAREIGLSAQQTEGVYFAALIHDVGKISIPAELLSKPVKLSPLELKMIQTHAQTGYDIIKGINFPWPIGQIVLQHHERLDGSGYPQRASRARSSCRRQRSLRSPTWSRR